MHTDMKTIKNNSGGGRESNLELFRIITMLCIVAHHYVVNSGMISMLPQDGSIDWKTIFLLVFGWGGKTGINCFVLITGYFMCQSEITVKKYLKLVFERYFYAILFFVIFGVTGYTPFSGKGLLKTIFPFFTIQSNFVACYLLFYLFIPFLNKLIHVMSEKEHLLLLGLCLIIYTVFPSFAMANVNFNYITWFIIIYFLASYLRIYEKTWFHNTRLWGALMIISLALSWASVVGVYWIQAKFGYSGYQYFFVSDSNKVLAVSTAVCAFMFFKNIKIRKSKFINTIAMSTFGVLLIHANSDSMRQWLWQDVLRNTEFFNSPLLIIHALLSVLGIYIVCTIIDQMRIRFLEKPLFKYLGKR